MTVTNRAYSLLEIKELDDEERVITGIASTPTPDRMADIVVPEGAQFALPIPLLWQHRSDQPIGHVIEAKITKAGIEIVAKIAKGVSEEIDRAWNLIKSGLVRGLSIGFRGLDTEQIPNSWGLKFETWEWLELSAVTIPANAEASITSVKQFDIGAPAASGKKDIGSPPVASGKRTASINLKKPQEKTMAEKKTIAQQIEALEATRLVKSDRMSAIMQASVDQGRSTDEAEQEEFDALDAEVIALDGDLKRFRALEKAQATEAKPINVTKAPNAAPGREIGSPVKIHAIKNDDPGIGFARFALSMLAGKGDVSSAKAFAEHAYGADARLQTVMKAAVAAGTTTSPTWAGSLVDYQNLSNEFIEFLRPRTLLGQFGTGNIPSLRPVPFNVRIPGKTTAGRAQWVGEAARKPVTASGYEAAELKWAKIAAISVVTEELERFSDPSIVRLVRDDLAEAVIERADEDFIDPAKAAGTGAHASPASILNGVAPIPATSDPATDINMLWAVADGTNLPTGSAVYVTDTATARALAGRKGPLGARDYPNVTITGGDIDGVPLLVSNYVPAGTFALVFAGEIYLADDGQVNVDISREATIVMDDDADAEPTIQQIVSMFQTNQLAIRAERYINWKKRRAQAAAYLTGVQWGPVSGS